MQGGMILIVTIGAIILIGLFIQILLWKSRQKDKKSIDQDWQIFLDVYANNDIKGIDQYGDKLIWNKYLKQNQLTKITEVVESKIELYPELEKLKLKAFNKQLHYNRIYPESGSSGGIKQSW